MNLKMKSYLKAAKQDIGGLYGPVLVIYVFAILIYGLDVNWEPLKPIGEHTITTIDERFINSVKEIALFLFYFPITTVAFMFITIVLSTIVSRKIMSNDKQERKVNESHSTKEDALYRQMSWFMKLINRTIFSVVSSLTSFGKMLFPPAFVSMLVIIAQYGFIQDLNGFIEVGNTLSANEIQSLNSSFKFICYASAILAVFWFVLFARDFYRGNTHQRVYINFSKV
tara:strand:- start:11415 stop:12092 length:678 start_codon:yes stop_codon:yes gene_type:complete